MKTCFTYFLIGFMLMGSFFVSRAQTNLYPSDISGLEVGFWVNSSAQPANSFTTTIVTDRVFDGTRSVKFDCPDAALPTDGNANAILGGTNPDFPVGNIAVSAGNYVFKAKVFIEGTAPSRITVFMAEKSASLTGDIKFTIPLSEVATGSWQTVSQVVTFPTDIAEMKTGLRIYGTDYSGLTGPSALYVDQIGLFDASSSITEKYSPLLDPNCDWQINPDFSDEFNNATINQTKWNTDVGDWGTWSWEPENAYITDTVLTLRMKQQQHTRGGTEYYFTSGIAQIREEFTYGYFEAKIKASDKGQGTCPAFWVYSVGQPTPTEEGGVQYSEIDAIEIFQIPNQLQTLEMNLHTRIIENGVLTWKRPGQGDTELTHNSWNAPWDPRDEYHTYAVWNRLDSIFWYVDGIQRGAKKNYYWHLPMHLTVSMGLRTPYEKYIDGVRTVMPYPESTPEPGFPTEMYCDYVRVWNTPAQLYADYENYDDEEFSVGQSLKFACRYFAGNGHEIIAAQYGGLTCSLQEVNAEGTIVNEIQLVDQSSAGKTSGVSVFSFSLTGLTPSDGLPPGNYYQVTPFFYSSADENQAIYMKGKSYKVTLVADATTTSSDILQANNEPLAIIHPNPTSGIINIRVEKSNLRELPFVIYNSIGSIVYNGFLTNGDTKQINLSGRPKGIYVLKAGNNIVEKLVIH